MKKKLFLVVTVFALVAVLATCLVACNKGFKWHSVGGGDATAEVKSNGGYVVKQGNYLYFINGYVGLDENNDFGTPVKQSIVRVEIKNGAIDNSTAVVVVPKSVYNTSTKGGFAIYGEWIYYVTPNYDRDKHDQKSTVNSDFMRTKIDGSATQKIATIATRGSEYFFTATRIWYYADSALNYVDFSGMKNKGDIVGGKGAKSGKVDATVTSVAWKYDLDTIFFTRNTKDEDTTLTYNELCSIKVDGSEEKVLATVDTFTQDPSANPQKVYTFSLLGVYKEADGATIYYTKSYKAASSTSTSEGLFMNKIAGEFVVANEKHLTTNTVSTMYPLGYAEGALAYNSDSKYCWYNGENSENPLLVTDASKTVWFAAGGYAYYTDSSSATKLYKISYREAENTSVVFEEGIKTDWLALDGVEDGEFVCSFFFATNDNNYVHYVNYATFDPNDEDAKSTMIGIYLDSEKPEEDEE
ncbi:MAG: hypothetical protein J5713_03615 [Clostridia bacterium]|nr:hypothetical protein [Clostridia bacterium]